MVNPACCLFQLGKKACGAGKGAGKGGGKGGKKAVEKELDKIREFRDEVLVEHKAGRILKWMYYYVFSPPVVALLQTSERLQEFMDRKIRPSLAEKCRAWTVQYNGGTTDAR